MFGPADHQNIICFLCFLRPTRWRTHGGVIALEKEKKFSLMAVIHSSVVPYNVGMVHRLMTHFWLEEGLVFLPSFYQLSDTIQSCFKYASFKAVSSKPTEIYHQTQLGESLNIHVDPVDFTSNKFRQSHKSTQFFAFLLPIIPFPLLLLPFTPSDA